MQNRPEREEDDMTIDFSNEQEQTFDFDFLSVARDVMEAVLDQEECPYEAQISLVLTDDDTIHSTNKEFRGIDRATDVLSFPMVDFPSPADYSCKHSSHYAHYCRYADHDPGRHHEPVHGKDPADAERYEPDGVRSDCHLCLQARHPEGAVQSLHSCGSVQQRH